MRNYLIVLAGFTLASCATTPRNYAPEVTALSFPGIGEEIEVSLGEDMLRQGFATEIDGILLRQENNIQNYVLSPGFYPQIGEDKDNTYHSFQIGNSFNGLGTISLTGGLLGPTSHPQSIRASRTKQQTCIIPGGISSAVCDTEYSFQREQRPILSERDFQQTLIYSGRVGDRIRIGYRESSGSVARPAFSNEAEYDLSMSNEIAYRGARIRVLEADNQKIRYVVLSNFNTP